MPQVFCMCTNCPFGQQCNIVGGALVLDSADIVWIKDLSDNKLTLHKKIYEEDKVVAFCWLSGMVLMVITF